MGFQASVQTEARISSAKKFNIRAHRPDQRQLAFVKVGDDIFSFCDDEKDYVTMMMMIMMMFKLRE